MERARFAKPMASQGVKFDSSVLRQSDRSLTVRRLVWDQDQASSTPADPTNEL